MAIWKNNMTWIVAALCWQSAASLYAQSDNVPSDSLKTDTLREVIVTGGNHGVQLPLSNSLKQDMKLSSWAQKYSPNGLLQKYAPTLHDQIMHPFGFAERKKNRKRKKVDKILQQYDAIDAVDPLQLLLDSVARAQGLKK